MKRIRIRKALALFSAFLLLAAVFVGCDKKPDEVREAVTVTVDIVKDAETKTVTLYTKEKYLANALIEKGIIAGYSKDGMYTEIDGIVADFAADGAWWCVTKSGEMLTLGMNDLVLNDGDKYEITYTK